MTTTTVVVRCSACGKRLVGHPTVRGGYAVNSHKDRITGRRCSGFYVHAVLPHRSAAS